ncbi:hypothetical protein [Paramagnetospirillum caucaseum]|nr:hypothetical protein [Paramagnetospirillum caucaseum]
MPPMSIEKSRLMMAAATLFALPLAVEARHSYDAKAFTDMVSKGL